VPAQDSEAKMEEDTAKEHVSSQLHKEKMNSLQKVIDLDQNLNNNPQEEDAADIIALKMNKCSAYLQILIY
jgi:hypothetical protein